MTDKILSKQEQDQLNKEAEIEVEKLDIMFNDAKKGKGKIVIIDDPIPEPTKD